jgi:hypothetical protein
LEIDVMKRYMALIMIVSAVLITAFNAFGQDEETPAQKVQRLRREQQTRAQRQRFQNMSPEEREKFIADMEQRRKQYQNMSDEQRAKLREQMRGRSGSRPGSLGRDEQLKSIKAIEAQLAKLKAAVEAGSPEDMSRLSELSPEERTKLREKIVTSMRERQMAIRAIEIELAKFRGQSRPATVSEARLGELREIHKLAVKEKATQTADRLDKLIMGIQRGSVSRERNPRESQDRPRRERPTRQDKTE